MMNPILRQKLTEVVEAHGDAIWIEPDLCESLLKHLCEQEDESLNLEVGIRFLIDALKHDIPTSLLRNEPIDDLVDQLTEKLHSTESVARWTIESWALALGIIETTQDQINEIQQDGEEELESEDDSHASLEHDLSEEETGESIAEMDESSSNQQSTPLIENTTTPLNSDSTTETTEQSQMFDLKEEQIEGFWETHFGVFLLFIVPILILPVIYWGVNQSSFDFPIFKTTNLKLDEIVVSSDGNGQYRTISQAINKVRSGGRIRVQSGTYNESLKIFKSVEIVGTSINDSIIRSSNEGCIQVFAQNVKIQNFGLENAGQNQRKYTVSISSGSLIIENCEVRSGFLAGVAVGKSGHADIIDCRILHGQDVGVWLYDGATGNIKGTSISGHQKTGVLVGENANLTISDSQVEGNQASGFYVYSRGRARLENCRISNNKKSGIVINEGGNIVIRASTISHNKFYGIQVHQNGNLDILDLDLQRISNNGYGPKYVEIR